MARCNYQSTPGSFIWQLQIKNTTQYYSLRFDGEKKREIKYKDNSRSKEYSKEVEKKRKRKKIVPCYQLRQLVNHTPANAEIMYIHLEGRLPPDASKKAC